MSTITEAKMEEQRLSPIHPGTMLMDEFILAGNMTVPQVAEAAGLPLSTLEALLRGECAITRPMAESFARCWRTTPDFWLNLQTNYEKRLATEPNTIGGK